MTGSGGRQVMIIAGEASGEARAARLVEELKQKRRDLSFFGIGGSRMRAAGVETLVDSRDMAVIGLFEILKHYRFIKGVLERMRELLSERRPDLLILVDYSGFNLRLAPAAKVLGIPVLYYISPQVWAWRRKRIYKIKEVVDQMAVVFPFEVPLYEKAGVPVRYVGHPLVDEVRRELSRNEALREFGLDPDGPVVGLFPGSRRSELQRLLPTLLDTAERVKEEKPETRFLIPQASTLDRAELDAYLEGRNLPITIIPERFYDVISGCDAIATASGTATLEVALMGVPLVVVYRVSSLSFFIMRRLIKLEHVAMCNIVAGKEVARELLQSDANPEAIADELLYLLRPEVQKSKVAQLDEIRNALGKGGGAERAAALALETMDSGRNAG